MPKSGFLTTWFTVYRRISVFLKANNVDPEQMLHSLESDLDANVFFIIENCNQHKCLENFPYSLVL